MFWISSKSGKIKAQYICQFSNDFVINYRKSNRWELLEYWHFCLPEVKSFGIFVVLFFFLRTFKLIQVWIFFFVLIGCVSHFEVCLWLFVLSDLIKHPTDFLCEECYVNEKFWQKITSHCLLIIDIHDKYLGSATTNLLKTQ